ncbi:MAG: sulfatase-like hydrolase/transferase [Alistipes sp.]|nr:sulfatase-like hydrolase/transferase [Alistipes sp.]
MRRNISAIVLMYLLTTVLMALQKPLFLVWYAARATEATSAELWGVVWHGLLLDSTTAAYLTVVPWLMMLVAVWVKIPERVMRPIMVGYFAVMAFVASLLVAVDMGLFRHWDFRLDSTIIPYLRTPKEAAASVTWGDVWPTLILFVAYGALLFMAWRPIARLYRKVEQTLRGRMLSTAVMLFTGGLLFLAIRGGVDTAPANVSKVYFSENMFLNQAATNPIFSFLSSAARSELKDDDYRYFTDEECEEIFSTLAGNTTSASSEKLLRTERPNVVLIMLESIGRTVMDEVVDGRAVAPSLQRLKSEGIWFENMYANSYRTDRGTVAVMSGYAAHPVVSVMKYPQKAHTLPAIARSLQNEGYATSFMYGGDANFTNTISYLYGTGVERITDKAQLSFDAPTNKWGYADDVVCPYFAEEVLSLSKQEKPFFATLLTLSSHEPFDVPYSAFEDKILNSVAFTDEAVGKMIDRWRTSDAWNDMLVILIADHGMPYPSTLTTGAEERQRIPMIWTGGALKQSGTEVTTYCSQADLAATLLAQLGIVHEDFIFSHDIFDPNQPHYAFWTWNNAFGLKDNVGKIIYNLTGEKTIQSEGDAPAYEQTGKAIVQTIHQDIRKR